MFSREFLKRNWLGILGLTVGIVGILVSIYFYNESKVERIPTFVLDPTRTRILSSQSVAETPITVLKKDGRQVKSDLTSVRFFFWNQGKQPIKREHILRNIYIILEDPRGEILDFRLLKTSRDITEFTLLPDTSDPKHRIKIDFSILENRDGATGQIIYEGNPTALFSVSGVIEGAKQIETSDTMSDSVRWFDYIKAFSFVWLMLICISVMWLLFVITKRFSRVITRFTSSRLGKFAKVSWDTISFLFAISLFLIMAYSLIIKPVKELKDRAKKEIVQKVPKDILPEK